MLQFDPSKRISASQALSHPYFANAGYTDPMSPSISSSRSSSSLSSRRFGRSSDISLSDTSMTSCHDTSVSSLDTSVSESDKSTMWPDHKISYISDNLRKYSNISNAKCLKIRHQCRNIYLAKHEYPGKFVENLHWKLSQIVFLHVGLKIIST